MEQEPPIIAYGKRRDPTNVHLQLLLPFTIHQEVTPIMRFTLNFMDVVSEAAIRATLSSDMTKIVIPNSLGRHDHPGWVGSGVLRDATVMNLP